MEVRESSVTETHSI